MPGHIGPNYGFVSHDWQRQASFFPMRHEGKPGFEWWIVELVYEWKPFLRKVEEIKVYISDILKDWADPMPLFIEATDFKDQIFRWEIYNRPSMKKWSKGRVVCVGDAVHPVSLYAACDMGMAIEDGYHLACSLDGVGLRDAHAVRAGFELYEKERVNYVNHNVEFARFLGRMFHELPYPLAWVRGCGIAKVYLLKFGRCKCDDIATRPRICKCVANVALRVSKGWFVEQAEADTLSFAVVLTYRYDEG